MRWKVQSDTEFRIVDDKQQSSVGVCLHSERAALASYPHAFIWWFKQNSVSRTNISSTHINHGAYKKIWRIDTFDSSTVEALLLHFSAVPSGTNLFCSEPWGGSATKFKWSFSWTTHTSRIHQSWFCCCFKFLPFMSNAKDSNQFASDNIRKISAWNRKTSTLKFVLLLVFGKQIGTN